MDRILFSIFFLFSGFLLSQTVKEIRSEVAEINQFKNYKIKTVPYSYFLDKGMVRDNGIEIKGYYKDGKIRKIDSFVGLSTWSFSTEYFLDKNEKLLFVYEKKYRIMGEDGYLKNPIKVREVRTYYAKGKIIKTPDEDTDEMNYIDELKELKKDLIEYK